MSETREQLITACGASAQSAMAAAAIEINRGSEERDVRIFPDTRGGKTVSTKGRDRRAEAIVSEVRQRLDELGGLYPCEGQGQGPRLSLDPPPDPGLVR